MFELLDTVDQQAVIKVVGVGGGGGNAVNYMQQSNIEGVEFINANTDVQALQGSDCNTILQLGSTLTKGLGAGADPDVGRQAAIEDRHQDQHQHQDLLLSCHQVAKSYCTQSFAKPEHRYWH